MSTGGKRNRSKKSHGVKNVGFSFSGGRSGGLGYAKENLWFSEAVFCNSGKPYNKGI